MRVFVNYFGPRTSFSKKTAVNKGYFFYFLQSTLQKILIIFFFEVMPTNLNCFKLSYIIQLLLVIIISSILAINILSHQYTCDAIVYSWISRSMTWTALTKTPFLASMQLITMNLYRKSFRIFLQWTETLWWVSKKLILSSFFSCFPDSVEVPVIIQVKCFAKTFEWSLNLPHNFFCQWLPSKTKIVLCRAFS